VAGDILRGASANPAETGRSAGYAPVLEVRADAHGRVRRSGWVLEIHQTKAEMPERLAV
jgi:hypothetical protein